MRRKHTDGKFRRGLGNENGAGADFPAVGAISASGCALAAAFAGAVDFLFRQMRSNALGYDDSRFVFFQFVGGGELGA